MLFFQIADFANAVNTNNQNSNQCCRGITYQYAAPERIDPSNNSKPTTQCDVYRSDYNSRVFIQRN